MKQKINLIAVVLVVISLNGCYERVRPSSNDLSDADIFVEGQPSSVGRLPDSNGLDIRKIRFGKHQESERLVLDVYRYDKDHIAKKAKNPGSYIYKYNPQSKRVSITLKGYSTCSALSTKKVRYIHNSRLIDKIVLSGANRNKELGFGIDLKHNVPINIFTLKNPARIVIDFKTSL